MKMVITSIKNGKKHELVCDKYLNEFLKGYCLEKFGTDKVDYEVIEAFQEDNKYVLSDFLLEQVNDILKESLDDYNLACCDCCGKVCFEEDLCHTSEDNDERCCKGGC